MPRAPCRKYHIDRAAALTGLATTGGMWDRAGLGKTAKNIQ